MKCTLCDGDGYGVNSDGLATVMVPGTCRLCDGSGEVQPMSDAPGVVFDLIQSVAPAVGSITTNGDETAICAFFPGACMRAVFAKGRHGWVFLYGTDGFDHCMSRTATIAALNTPR